MVHVRTLTVNAPSLVFLVSFCVFIVPALKRLGSILVSACACVRPSVRASYGPETYCMDSSLKIAGSFFKYI